MKKIDQKTLEKFAKEKNIDKNKVEKIAEGYKNKSTSLLPIFECRRFCAVRNSRHHHICPNYKRQYFAAGAYTRHARLCV